MLRDAEVPAWLLENIKRLSSVELWDRGLPDADSEDVIKRVLVSIRAATEEGAQQDIVGVLARVIGVAAFGGGEFYLPLRSGGAVFLVKAVSLSPRLEDVRVDSIVRVFEPVRLERGDYVLVERFTRDDFLDSGKYTFGAVVFRSVDMPRGAGPLVAFEVYLTRDEIIRAANECAGAGACEPRDLLYKIAERAARNPLVEPCEDGGVCDMPDYINRVWTFNRRLLERSGYIARRGDTIVVLLDRDPRVRAGHIAKLLRRSHPIFADAHRVLLSAVGPLRSLIGKHETAYELHVADGSGETVIRAAQPDAPAALDAGDDIFQDAELLRTLSTSRGALVVLARGVGIVNAGASGVLVFAREDEDEDEVERKTLVTPKVVFEDASSVDTEESPLGRVVAGIGERSRAVVRGVSCRRARVSVGVGIVIEPLYDERLVCAVSDWFIIPLTPVKYTVRVADRGSVAVFDSVKFDDCGSAVVGDARGDARVGVYYSIYNYNCISDAVDYIVAKLSGSKLALPLVAAQIWRMPPSSTRGLRGYAIMYMNVPLGSIVQAPRARDTFASLERFFDAVERGEL